MVHYERKQYFRKLLVILLSAALAVTGCARGGDKKTETGKAEETVSENIQADTGADNDDTGKESGQKKPLVPGDTEKLPEWEWQAQTVFPDRRGKVDDTLAMNSLLSFKGYHGQGKMYFTASETVSSFHMYVNNREVDTSGVKAGNVYELDFGDAAVNGLNTLQVSGIEPMNAKEAVRVWIPYPEVIQGVPGEEGISDESLSLISDIVSSDVESGFTAAQLAVVRNGRLVYENSWGKVNSYLPDGKINSDSPDVNSDTMFDLASVTKMFATNYALQKLVTDGKLTIDAHIVDFLGERFSEDTMDFAYQDAPDPGIETMKQWKAELTVKDLLCHQGGFPASPRYCNPYVDAVTQKYGEEYENILFAGNDATEDTREATIEAICKTPLMYEPGTKTVYSDVDYMILGLVVESVSGKKLDQYVKDTFYDPMGLKHITFTPSRNGFSKEDCAATELNGNTRDGFLQFPGIRTETIQGEVHDEMAYYSMGGVSGHAGLFSNATDLAKLASVMLTGGYGEHKFFSRNVMDLFTSPKNSTDANWGLGWWREGDDQRTWYFGESGSGTFGHQGWTGTMVMIDPVKDLVVVYLTNKINSLVTDKIANANKFDGGYYTSSTLGFVPQLIQLSMDYDGDIEEPAFSLLSEMVNDSIKLVDPAIANEADHPAVKNAESKINVLKKYADRSGDPEFAKVCENVDNRWKEYKEEAARSPEGILHDMTTEEKVEEMLMPDVRYWSEKNGDKAGVTELNAELSDMLKKHKFGGVILFADNIKDAGQTAKLTDDLQKAYSSGNDKQKLFIAVDQEGGRVTRLGTGTQMPGNMALGATGDTAMAKDAAYVIGKEIRSLGFNIDFAPVVDVNQNPSNPVIGIRSFSDSPEMTADFGCAFTEGLHEAGVISSLKHFPGHGDTQTDSHTGLPSIDKDYDTIKENELIPFEKCLKNGADMVMTAHIQYPEIEKETYTSIKDGEDITLPATLSKEIIGGILRKDIGFDGVVITDAMDMAAVSENFAPMDSARLAINAGVDMMLMPVEMDSPEGIKAMDRYISDLAALVKKGEIPESRINESVLRILRLKEKYGLLGSSGGENTESSSRNAGEEAGSKENHDRESEIAERSITLLKNENDLLPLKKNSGTAVILPYGSQIKSVEFAVRKLKDEGVLEKDAKVSSECLEDLPEEDRDDLIERSLSGNDVVIAVSALYGKNELDPSEEDGWCSALYDRLIKRAHEEEKKVVILSAQLPYDAARYQEADAVLCCYNARGMTEIPGDNSGDTPQYGPNIPAAIYAAFGGCGITGRLPVNIPELDAHYGYSDRILYNRGDGISIPAPGKDGKKSLSGNETPWQKVVLGDEQFDEYIPLIKDKKVALFSNHTGIVGDKTESSGETGWVSDQSLIPFGKEGNGKNIGYGQHILDALIEHGADVTAIFSPEHGFRGTADAGENVDSSVDEKTGIPILSLYSANSHYPSEADMERFDTLVIDMQDVGLRYYTYYISMYYLLDACAQHDKEVIILDRPNPNGFYVDGPILKKGYESGVGKLPIPVVYGMTWGELAKMINGEGWLEAGKNKLKLTVIPCRNYTHQTKTALIRNPSPNIKDMKAVYLYASTCFFENTAFSVGRGTEYPFEVYGSPVIKDAERFSFSFTPRSMDGAVTPPFEGKVCRGRDLREIPLEDIWKNGVDPGYILDAYHAYMDTSPDSDFFGTPDQKGRYWLDLLSGSDELRKKMMAGETAEEIKASWQDDIEAFKKQRKPYLLYEDN
ncbi:MAG: penicillin binding protein PBP4B [Lachnospiraceae bacterium]|nr:penicillin binding protein PBP4B [Lachnospiraceae bacterium]